MQIWLIYEKDSEQEQFQLPVNPPTIKMTSPHHFNDLQVPQLGEYTVIGDKQLREFSLSSFFPRDYHRGYCEYDDLALPWDSVNLIEKWQRIGEPIRLVVTGQNKINYPVTIRSFQYEERAGSPGDVYYDLQLKEYRYLTFEKIEEQDGGKKLQQKRPSTKKTPKTYIVVPGDSLWKIAHKMYRDGSKWQIIYNANRKTIGEDPDKIFPGQKLVIPA
ncbi:LysM peptidoglycan-binding domain-containing protein [Longirhabdus pacifica]|uniref:LysM peptidoglycan-binding domain-containing protein n=1 Tax=Longirhabdus pacifica TaxID=2305227 RepID=UPI001F0BF72C|nr:LysM peptidoglycan-binding domain-containing protein [Longirhabdus pacifica]